MTDRRTTNSVTKDFNYAWNFDSSLASILYPSGRRITYAYNAAARALSAIDAVNSINYATQAAYAPHGAFCSLRNDASIVSTFTFNSRLQPNRMHVTTTGAPPSPCAAPAQNANILDLTYGFNTGSTNNGNVASIANNLTPDRSQTFTYDQLNRVSTAQSQAATGPNAWGLGFGYDIWANLLTQTVSKGTAPALSLTVNANNRVTNTGFTYDTAGNLTADGSNAYSYDAENRLTTTAGVTYTYDGDGRRVKKSNGTLYWYGAGAEVLMESDLAGSNPEEYIFFGSRRLARRKPTGEVNYYFADHLGSSRVVTNATGAILDDSDFYPFGAERIVLSSSGNHYKFTSKERDSESGLDYFGARYYSSNTGRFLSADSIGNDNDSSDPQRWNLYAYARNNPLQFVDDTGNEIKYGPDLKNAQEVQDIVNAILATPGASEELQGYVGPGNPDLVITSGDLSGMDEVNPDGTVSRVQANTDLGVRTTNAKTKYTGTTTITIDNRTTPQELLGVVLHEVKHAGRVRKDAVGYERQAREEKKALPHDQRPIEKEANRFRDTYRKPVKRQLDQIREQRKREEKKKRKKDKEDELPPRGKRE